MQNRSYLGDGVYASWDGKSVILELEVNQKGRIYLNKDNLRPFFDFLRLHVPQESLGTVSVYEIPTQEVATMEQIVKEINSDYIDPTTLTKN